MSARSIAHVLFRHRRVFLAVLVLAVGAGGLLAVRPPLYRAEAMLLVGSERPEGGRALAALFESRDLQAEIAAAKGQALFPALPSAEHLRAFERALTVAPEAALVRVAFDAATAELAADTLSALLAGARRNNAAVFGAASASDEARAQLTEFRRRHGVFDPAAEREALAARRPRLQGERTAAESEAAALAGSLKLLQQRLASTPATIRLSSESERTRVVEQARAKVFDLQTQEQELLGKYQDSSPFVQRIRAERVKAQTLLDQLMTTSDTRTVEGANPLRQQIEGEVLRTEAALSAAQARAGALSAQLLDLDRQLERLGRLERELRPLAEAAQENGAARTHAVDGIGIVQGAAAPPRMVGPGPLETLAIATLLGLLSALAAVAVAQRLSNRFSTPDEVEKKLGLPVLATIPRES